MGFSVFIFFLKVYVNMHCTDIVRMDDSYTPEVLLALDLRLRLHPSDCLLKQKVLKDWYLGIEAGVRVYSGTFCAESGKRISVLGNFGTLPVYTGPHSPM